MNTRAVRRLCCAVLAVLLLAACTGGPRTDTWRLIDAELISAGRQPFDVSALTRIPTAFLAMGTNTDGSVDVWSSTDGESWAVSSPPEFRPPPGREYEVRHLMAVGEGAVAIGAEGDPVEDALTDVLVWASPDGVTWHRDTSLSDLWRAPTLGIGGAVADGPDVYFTDADAGLFRRDATGRWDYRTLPESCRINAPLRSRTDLGAMLLGFEATEPELGRVQATRATVCAARPTGEVTDYSDRIELAYAEYAASVDGRTVVTGYPPSPNPDELEPPAATRTEDGGATWSAPVPLPVPDGLTQNGNVRALQAVEGVLIATGEARGSGAVPIPVVWTSTDSGSSWQAHTLPPLGEMGLIGDVASHNGRIVMLAQFGYGPVDTVGLFVNF